MTCFAEVFGFHFKFAEVTYLIFFAYLFGILERNLGFGILYCLHNLFEAVYLDILFLGIENNAHIRASAVVSLEGADESRLNLFQHIFFRYAALFLESVKGIEKFGIHFL